MELKCVVGDKGKEEQSMCCSETATEYGYLKMATLSVNKTTTFLSYFLFLKFITLFIFIFFINVFNGS